MQSAQGLCNLASERLLEWERVRADDGDLEAVFGQRGRRLQADEATTDNDRPRAVADPGENAASILQAAQNMDAGKVSPRNIKRARGAARSEEHGVVVERGAVGEGEAAGGRVKAGRGAVPPLDAVLLVEPWIPERCDIGRLHAALQHELAQCGAVVRRVGFGTKQDDTTVEAELA